MNPQTLATFLAWVDMNTYSLDYIRYSIKDDKELNYINLAEMFLNQYDRSPTKISSTN